MALKRSAGLETVACWQMDSQWTDRDVRDQLDALFAHRVYFATASTDNARRAAGLMMAAYSDQVRADDRDLPALARPDARLHLPKHHAICSWVTQHGRQPPFLASTVPLRVDAERIAHHHARQAARGGRRLESFQQAHWDRGGAATPRPSAVPPSDARLTRASVPDAAVSASRGHLTDPTGERERDDFAELRDVPSRRDGRTVGRGGRARRRSAASPRHAGGARRR
jgi:hypothetical protein